MSVIKEILVPHEIVNDEFVVVNSLEKNNGEKVRQGEIIASIETSKADFSIEAEGEGYVQFAVAVGDEIPVGGLIGRIYSSEKEAMKNPEPVIGKTIEATIITETEFSKSALELITGNKIDKAVFRNKGFVTKKDVEQYLAEKGGIVDEEPAGADTNVTIEKLSPAKRRETVYLSAGQNAGLTCTFSINIDNTGILNYARKNHKIFRLTIIPSVVREVALLLERFPILNSYYHQQQVVKYNSINIGYALDIEHGLKVVTLYDTNKLSTEELEKQLMEKIDRYSKNTLEIADLTGSTFTITDLSKSGIHYFQPLINKQQCAILGVSGVDFKKNNFNISITFDHRVTEGRVVSAFLNELKRNIEKLVRESQGYENPHTRITKLLEELNARVNDGTFGNKEQAELLKRLLEGMLE